jgi:hypothetical protein
MSSSGTGDSSSWTRIRGWFSDLSKTKKVATLLVTIAGGFVTVATAISMAVSGYQWVFHSETPRSTEREPTAAGVDFSDVKVQPNVTLGQYLEMPGLSDKVRESEVSNVERQWLGNIIRFRLELKAFKKRTVSLKWTVSEAATLRPVEDMKEQPAWPQERVRPLHDTSENQYETWVPFPLDGRGTFLITLEAYATIKGNTERLDSTSVKVSTPDNVTPIDHNAEDTGGASVNSNDAGSSGTSANTNDNASSGAAVNTDRNNPTRELPPDYSVVPCEGPCANRTTSSPSAAPGDSAAN